MPPARRRLWASPPPPLAPLLPMRGGPGRGSSAPSPAAMALEAASSEPGSGHAQQKPCPSRNFKQDFNSKANPGLEPRRKRGRAGLAVWRESPSWVPGAWVSSGAGLCVGGRRAGGGRRDEMRWPSAPAGPVRPSPNCRILKGTRFQSLHLLSQRIFPVALRQKNLEGTRQNLTRCQAWLSLGCGPRSKGPCEHTRPTKERSCPAPDRPGWTGRGGRSEGARTTRLRRPPPGWGVRAGGRGVLAL